MPNVMKWLQPSFLAALCAAALAPAGALADPVISRIHPLEGRLNRLVVIEGSGFGHTQGTSVVQIGDRQVPIRSYSDGLITISVNPESRGGPLALDTIYSLRVVTERSSKKSNAVDFKILSGDPAPEATVGTVPGAPDQPFISSLNGSLFCPGDILTLSGGGFGGTQGQGFVTINVPFLDGGGTVFFQPFAALVHAWSESAIAVSLFLSQGALPGNYTATVQRENGKSATVSFTVGAIVNGDCVIPTPQASVSVSDLDFGTQALNTTSGERSFLLTNSSAVPLRIINVTFNGLHQGDFRFTGGDNGGILAPGDTRVITLTFTPSATGLRTARVDLITDAPSSPDSVALIGIGE